MVEHCDYVRQATASSDDGATPPRPGGRLPGGKHVVVDAKAPLAAYLDAFETTDDESESDTSRTMRARCETTSRSSRRSSTGGSSSRQPDFVVMFLPDESYLRAAHEHDPRWRRTRGART